MGGFWLYDVANMSFKTIPLTRGSYRCCELDDLQTNLDNEISGNPYVFHLNRAAGAARVCVHVNDSDCLVIVVEQDHKRDYKRTWEKNPRHGRRVSFIFEENKVWVYSPNQALKMDNEVHDGWSLTLTEPERKWKPYDNINN